MCNLIEQLINDSTCKFFPFSSCWVHIHPNDEAKPSSVDLHTAFLFQKHQKEGNSRIVSVIYSLPENAWFTCLF